MPEFAPQFRFLTYPANALHAIAGANEGDPIGMGEAAIPGDTYRLARDAAPQRLAICDDSRSGQRVATGSDVGQPGEGLSIVECHTLMDTSGDMTEVLVLRRKDGEDVATLHLLPLSPLRPGTDYDLIGSSGTMAPDRFADIVSVSFFAGTQLTLAGGAQALVEDLKPGDRVLTRDHGPRPIRWIGHQTRRATGTAAPIRITAGTLNAARDLRLSPHHRLFIWQRHDALGTGRAEVLVKAELLINGTTVVRDTGGHVDSYQILFDRREIIFAEGIAVESLLVTSDLRHRLPEGMDLDELTQGQGLDATIEIEESSLDTARDTAAQLTRASRGQDS